jgi:hypothetical protein
MRQGIIAGLMAASAMAGTLVLGTGAASASGGWTIQSTYAPSPAQANKKDIALRNVSCPASNACLTIGLAGSARFLSETWNGTTWSPLLTPYPAAGSALTDVACSGGSACTAVGLTFTPAVVEVPLAERWNGTSWQVQQVPGPGKSALSGVACPAAALCIAVGHHETGSFSYTTLAEAWNGTSWAVLPTPPPGKSEASLDDVSCPAPSDCVAIGQRGNSPSQSVPFIERWNGTAWAIQATPHLPSSSSPNLDSVSCAAASSCTAIGSTLTGSRKEPLVEHWNGTSWVLQHITGAANRTLDAVSCPSATSCTATGYYANSANVLVPLAVHWNGTAWAVQHTPAPPRSTESSFSDVSCPAVTACEAVGFFHQRPKGGGLRDRTLIETGP